MIRGQIFELTIMYKVCTYTNFKIWSGRRKIVSKSDPLLAILCIIRFHTFSQNRKGRFTFAVFTVWYLLDVRHGFNVFQSQSNTLRG